MVDEPESVPSGAEQSVAISGPAFTSGVVVFDETETVEVAVHPFAGLVTVNVYVPADVITGVSD